MKSYIQIFRNLSNNRGFRYIKIMGLAMGIAVALLVALWAYDELSFNKCHENYSSLAKLMRNEPGNTGDTFTSDVFTTGMGTLLKSSFGSHFSKIAMVRARIEERVISSGENKYTEPGYFMQADAPDMLSLQMVSGVRDGLKDINSILLSQSLAKKLFGNSNPIGQFVKMDASYNMMITGIYKDLPKNSEFAEAHYFAPLDAYLAGWSNLDVWNNYNMWVLLQIKPDGNFEKTSSIIRQAVQLHDPKSKTEFFLHPVSKWHLYSKFENGVLVTSGRLELLLLIISIGFLVLLLACINYMNLSTVNSTQHSKEIGIRKVLGSKRYQLVKQLLSESLTHIIIAYFFALILTLVALPWFNHTSGKELSIQWHNYGFWLFCIAALFIINLIAGGYPAVYLSSLKPVKAIPGRNHKTLFRATSREILVVFQFTISIALIIASIIIYKQVLYAKDRPVGYTPKGLITLYMNTPDYKGKYLTLRDELKKTGVIQEIAAANYPVIGTKGWNSGFDWKGKNKDFSASFNIVRATYEYAKTIGLQFVNGRDFSRDLQSDISGMIINESALKLMGLEAPIGEVVNSPADAGDFLPRHTIIGVVKDMIKGSPYDPTVPVFIFISKEDLKCLYMRINPKISAREALPKIESVLGKIVPLSPFDYAFVDDQYNAKFQEEERIGKLATSFTFMAIVISCLGLFGFAAFVVERRTKEIGVRRVNGAKIHEILTMLNKNFTLWVVISFILACPIAWYAMHKWLQNFAYKTELSWWVFVLAGAVAVVVALLTVSWQSWRAATRNPVESLRYE